MKTASTVRASFSVNDRQADEPQVTAAAAVAATPISSLREFHFFVRRHDFEHSFMRRRQDRPRHGGRRSLTEILTEAQQQLILCN
jgi:hypothetical protein